MTETTPQPETIAIYVSELRGWLKAAESGLHPEVRYRLGEDRAMLDDAYEIRGDRLRYIANQLNALLH